MGRLPTLTMVQLTRRVELDDPFLADVVRKVQEPVECHLHTRFNQWRCTDAMSQVVSGTVWFVKIDVGTECALWIKAFDQPVTQTFEVVGVVHEQKCMSQRLQIISNNCQIDCLAEVEFEVDFIISEDVEAIEAPAEPEPEPEPIECPELDFTVEATTEDDIIRFAQDPN